MDSPITIHKSLFGLFVIYLAGSLLTFLVLLGIVYNVHVPGYGFANPLTKLLAAATVLIVIGTFISAYVYMLSKVVLDAQELRFTNWATLFSSNVAVCEWRQVQDIDVKKGGIFSQAFGYGTLLVQTAGTERNLRIPMIPNVEHWRDVIAQRADKAATPVKQAS